MKTKSKNDGHKANATDISLQRLARAPETAHQIYELAESLYLREHNDSARITLADIERIGEYLREVETDGKRMKSQFLELSAVEGSFYSEEIPIGF